MAHGEEDGEILRSSRSTLAAEQQNAKVVVNVGGIRHETYLNTLRNIPDTRLYWITENGTQLADYDPEKNEYFFDRHPGVFVQILNFYRTGKLHCPMDVCGPLFEEELAFWGIDELQVESCCWLNYKKHREAQANLETFDSVNESDGESFSDMDMTVYGLVADAMRNRNKSVWKKVQPKVWTTFEEPYSSRVAQVIAFMTLILILASVLTFCLESVPYFMQPSSIQKKTLAIVEIVCVSWFTLEFLLRLIFCPNKLQFAKKFMNWIDLGAVLPFYIQLFLSSSNLKTIIVLRVVRLIRVFRIFKLSRHSYGLQILGHTLRASFSELFLLVFFLSIGVIIFSSIIFYAEKDVNPKMFPTIPHGFWWAVVTMTTLGYGDVVPKSWQGKIVGSLCAVCGVLMIALPVPVIVSNFSLYYSHAKARLKLPKRKRPLILGAANALKVSQPFPKEGGSSIFSEIMRNGAVPDDESVSNELQDNNNTRRNSFPSRRTSNCTSARGASPVPRKRLSLLSSSPAQTPTSQLERNEQQIVPNLNKNRRHTLVVPNIEHSPVEIEMHKISHESRDNEEETGFETNKVKTDQGDKANLSVLREKNERASSSRNSDTEISPAQRRKSSWKQKSSTGSNGGSTSLSVDSTGSPLTSPHARMGRRGSLYVVGFTAKHWQNKALKKNKNPQKSNSTQTAATNTSDNSFVEMGKNEVNNFLTPDFRSTDFGSARSSISDTYTNTTEVSSPTSKQMPEGGLEADYNQNIDLQSEDNLEHDMDSSKIDELSTIGTRVQMSINCGTQSPRKQKSEPILSSTKKMNSNAVIKATLSAGENSTAANCLQTSTSIESNDSSSKHSDDSVIKIEQQRRRGSSPLMRQKAVFNFDRSDHELPVDSTVGSTMPKNRLGEESWSALSPLIEQANEISPVRKNADPTSYSQSPQNSSLSSIPSERNTNNNKLHSPPFFVPTSYVNGSYYHDEEERQLPELPLTKKRGLEDCAGSGCKQGFSKTVRYVTQQASDFSDYSFISSERKLEDSISCSSPTEKPESSLTKSENSLPSITEEVKTSRSSPHSQYYGRIFKDCLHRKPHSLPGPFYTGKQPVLTSTAISNASPHERRVTIHDTPHRDSSGNMVGQGKDNFGFSNTKDNVPEHKEMEEMPKKAIRDDILQRRHSQALYINIPQRNVLEQINVESLNKQYTISDSGKVMRDMATSPLPLHYLSNVSNNAHNMSHNADANTCRFSYSLDDLHQDISNSDPLCTTQAQSCTTAPENAVDIKLREDDTYQYYDEHATDVAVEMLPNIPLTAGRKYSVYSIPSNTKPIAHLNSYPDPRRPKNRNDDHFFVQFETASNQVPRQIHGIRISSKDDLGEENNTYPVADKERFKPINNSPNESDTLSNGGIDQNQNFPSKFDGISIRDGSLLSPTKRKNRADRQSVQFYHDALQNKDNFRKSPTSADRWKARAMFFGDSGISSVGSNSTTSITHSTDSESDTKERRESAGSISRVDIMNPIHETEIETSSLVKQVVTAVRKTSVTKKTPNGDSTMSEISEVNVVSTSTQRNNFIDVLKNSDHYETSLV